MNRLELNNKTFFLRNNNYEQTKKVYNSLKTYTLPFIPLATLRAPPKPRPPRTSAPSNAVSVTKIRVRFSMDLKGKGKEFQSLHSVTVKAFQLYAET